MGATDDWGQRESAATTVVVPTFNGSRFLRATLDSLAAQSQAPDEVIVVDDGSTDDTVDIARSHEVVSRVVVQPNFGVAVARNQGLAAAATPWVAFIDQDDIWHGSRLSVLHGLAHATGAAAVAAGEIPFACTDERQALHDIGDGREKWPKVWIERDAEAELVYASYNADHEDGALPPITRERLQYGGAATITTSVMYARRLATAGGGFAPHARALDDYVLNINVTRLAGPIQRTAAGPLYYRVHPTSTTTRSPMVAPFLSTSAALRLGGVFPHSLEEPGSNIQHLLFGLHEADLSTSEQLALLVLNTRREERGRWFARWFARKLHLR